ncbi:MAG: phosphatidylserine/phosphatidylglycerophosphate/cardiolipin synthase family protein [Bacteroidales bacterium]|jgi:cardiolipin synthase|nr:phosphatidylserine/phosphatidylglycerophosphate/cardiolipin synthase family protein [Bacteroidales bacterium]
MCVSLFDDNLLLFSAMIDDIRAAKKSVLLETYRFGNDAIGKRFREALLEKAQQGIEVRLLLDAYGTKANEIFFAQLIKSGVEIRFFKKIKFFFSNFFARNHTRNHRKILLIDDEIVYVGSSNLTAYSISWRDLNFRIEGTLASVFKNSFEESFLQYRQYKLYDVMPFKKVPPVTKDGYTLYEDTPSISYQTIRRKILQMISIAQSEIIIETPYFLPGYKMRKALVTAAERGVNVRIFLPLHSDIPLIDVLRNKYLGAMWKQGIKWRLYKPDNLHAKCVIVDGTRFLVGSSNLDYRSFRYQYDLMLYGTANSGSDVDGEDGNIGGSSSSSDNSGINSGSNNGGSSGEKILSLLKEHIDKTDEHCIEFDYEKWENTPILYKLTEWLITPFRRLF